MSYSNIMLNILEKEHPKVHQNIVNRMDALGIHKHPITALNLIKVINLFLQYKQSPPPLWQKEVTMRRELVAVMLLYFCPEKVYGLLEENSRNGLVKELKQLTGCAHQLISNDISTVLVWYKTYADFKKQITSILEFINKS